MYKRQIPGLPIADCDTMEDAVNACVTNTANNRANPAEDEEDPPKPKGKGKAPKGKTPRKRRFATPADLLAWFLFARLDTCGLDDVEPATLLGWLDTYHGSGMMHLHAELWNAYQAFREDFYEVPDGV